MNYIDVFSDSGSEIKLKNKKELRNTITEVYIISTNAAHTKVRHSSAEGRPDDSQWKRGAWMSRKQRRKYKKEMKQSI